tara:strand:- start:958 stop:1470 length:513 start_codon:yes stop_codon:yes gene_type:complete
MNESFWTRIIYVVSIVISLAVAFLILGPRPEGVEGMIDVSILPLVNASLNGITTLLLLVGYILIFQKKINAHKSVMLTAFGTSSLFLISYIIYHWFKSGPKMYVGDYKIFYFTILISHIILAALIIPLALFTLYRGWISDINKHKKIAKITLPIWLYVSITGVIIYMMLY